MKGRGPTWLFSGLSYWRLPACQSTADGLQAGAIRLFGAVIRSSPDFPEKYFGIISVWFILILIDGRATKWTGSGLPQQLFGSPAFGGVHQHRKDQRQSARLHDFSASIQPPSMFHLNRAWHGGLSRLGNSVPSSTHPSPFGRGWREPQGEGCPRLSRAIIRAHPRNPWLIPNS